MKRKHPKTIAQLTKEIRLSRARACNQIAEAIEAVEVHREADYIAISGEMHEFLRRSERRILYKTIGYTTSLAVLFWVVAIYVQN